MKDLIFFYGIECPHCVTMEIIVDKLISEGFNIKKLEVWHNENNANEMRKYAKIITEASGGDLAVPTFLDKENERAICGEMSYEDLKQWINKE